MMRNAIETLFSVAVVSLGISAAPLAHAIVIRHDVPDSEYVVEDADYPALVDLYYRGDCIGTLVHGSYLLTAAHCVDDFVLVGDSVDINGVSHTVAEIIFHPGWILEDDLPDERIRPRAFPDRYENHDIALVRLESRVTGVDPLPIYRGSEELGSVITLVGGGGFATGLVGEPGAAPDGKLRQATNIVSNVNDHFLEIVFERGGEQGVTELEGVGVSGDSGCPSFIEVDGKRYIAGLNSLGDAPNGIEIGQYGAEDYQSRVSRYLDWLDSVVGTWPSDTDTGEREDNPGDGDPGDTDPAQGAGGGCSAAGLPGGSGSALGLLLALVAAYRRRLA